MHALSHARWIMGGAGVGKSVRGRDRHIFFILSIDCTGTLSCRAGIDRFAKQTRSASPRQGQKVAREA